MRLQASGQSPRVALLSYACDPASEVRLGVSGHAVFAKVPYRPPIVTPKPNVRGVQVARVVGPPDEEIHTDEFGRIRVQFPWDRHGKYDDDVKTAVEAYQRAHNTIADGVAGAATMDALGMY